MRYAIYFSPPEDDGLSIRAANWLGRDAFRERAISQPEVDNFSGEAVAALTAEPRRYGFHATLKAPFELDPARSEDELLKTFEAFAEVIAAFEIPELVLGQLGAFFALVPAQRSEELQAFAGACVKHFEPFRAALSEADIARRRPERLSPAERHNLVQWGYPYVFEEFRFHMTLTGQVPPEQQVSMRQVLAAQFAPFIGKPLAISHLSLFIEPERGAPFVMKRIVPLRLLHQRKTA